ncbi:MAG: hypothetical protein P8X68_12855, partial [Desulfobacterales bacterium]
LSACYICKIGSIFNAFFDIFSIRVPHYFDSIINQLKTDKNDIITEVFKSKAILVGSPTINQGILVSVAGLLEEIKGLQFKNKMAAAFCCYGWSGESTKIISENLKVAGFELVDDGIKVMWNPDAENVKKCIEYGSNFADIARR